MESIPKKGYFAKELALRTLFGDQAFADLKKLLDPCCGIGVDKLCVEPCGGDPTMCPEIAISRVVINCVTGECELDIVSSGTGGAVICGRIQVQVPLPPESGMTGSLDFDLDAFCVNGDGTTTFTIPNICGLIDSGIFEFGPFIFANSNFFAYSPSGPASNVFPSSLVSLTCPAIVLCEDSSEFFDCAVITCVDGALELAIDVAAFQTDATLIVQWSPNVGPEVWTNLGNISALPYLTSHIETVDASALAFSDFYKFRVIDSVDGTIISNTVSGVSTPAGPC